MTVVPPGRGLPRWIGLLIAGLAALPVLAAAGFALLVAALPMPSLDRAGDLSPVVLAEDGSILTAYLSRDGMWRLAAGPDDLPPFYLDMLLAYEDKRFWRHDGVDPAAVLRAAFQLASTGHVVSGASTLTMQVVRLLDGREDGLAGKLRQAALAVKLEQALDKRQILALYLTLAPYGGNIEGVRMAALQYFGKEPGRLTVGEAALLVALPQSPEIRRPDLHTVPARLARDRVLARSRGILPAATLAAAAGETVPADRGRYVFRARHLSDRLHAAAPDELRLQTLIDPALQVRAEEVARKFVERQPDAANVAVIVVRNSDLAVRAYIGGGASYFDYQRAGMLDLAEAVRSPGSALKPVIYGFGFEDLLVHPDTVVTDDATRIGGYAPENFDKIYHGDLTVRDALIESVNTVPVLLLNAVGPERFIGSLREAGIGVALPESASAPGLAVALGGVGITLDQIAALYAGLANRGAIRPLRYLSGDALAAPRRLISGDAAWAVTDILADQPPPRGRADLHSRDGGRRVAYKTGTSYGYRDAWAIGYDADHTIAVWVGRPDGIGRPGETGASAAVPLMFRLFDMLPAPARDVASDPPTESILAQRGALPLRLQRFPPGHPADQLQPAAALTISFPADGSTLSLERAGDGLAELTIVSRGGRGPFHWFLDGRPLGATSLDGTARWTPGGPGEAEISVVDSAGNDASASVWIQ